MYEGTFRIRFLMVIAGRKQRAALAEALHEAGAKLINTAYGKSSVNAPHLMELLGFVPEEQKVVFTCLLRADKIEEVMNMLTDRFHFNRPNTGIAFTIAVERLSL